MQGFTAYDYRPLRARTPEPCHGEGSRRPCEASTVEPVRSGLKAPRMRWVWRCPCGNTRYTSDAT